MHFSPRLLAASLGLLLLPTAAPALDWTGFRGPQRDDVSHETGLLKEWPADGPKRLWLFEKAGSGYSGFSVVGSQLFTLGTRDNQEILLCLDAATGQELWTTPTSDILDNKWGNGPRGTPTVDGDKVYALSGPGLLVCAQAKDGKTLWTKKMSELGGKTPGWGYTESVLVDGAQVVCTPGGPQGTVAAFDKASGKLLWQSKDWTDGAQYASIVKATINGAPQYLQLTQQHFAGVNPKDGKVLWQVDWAGKTAVIPTPIVKDNLVFITSGYGVGCKLVRIQPGNKVEDVYENKLMKNHHGGVVLVGDKLYGYSDGLGWLCLDFATGNQVWAERNKLGKGCVSSAEGKLYCLEEGKGTVVLAEANDTGWVEHGRFELQPQSTIRSPQGHIWTHPVIANGRLYLRDQEFIYCFDIKAK